MILFITPPDTHTLSWCSSGIASHLLKANFIIHEAVQIVGFPENQIESFNYKVTFLGKDAMPLLHQAKVWVSGGGMNNIITPQYKRKFKFFFDETISVKECWVTRGGCLKAP